MSQYVGPKDKYDPLLSDVSDTFKRIVESSRSPDGYSPEQLTELERDAKRYRFLRDEDNWGEDSGDDCWGSLAEAHAGEFDAVVDSRMAKSE